MNNIAIIDADLIGRKRHRFPNLCSMKLSGYFKDKGNNIKLVTDYKDLYKDENIWIEYQNALNNYIKEKTQETLLLLNKAMSPCFDKNNFKYNKIYISKVFTDTEIDEDFLRLDIVEYGGTGFYYDKAPNLPDEIEHHMPDYHLYDEWVQQMLSQDWEEKEFEYYTKHSIGFTTRGCFRQCSFCVNKKYKKVMLHSPVEEFLDESRPYICLLDDNVLGFGLWEQVIDSLVKTKKPFQFKQGMDLRIMTDKKAQKLGKVKYYGDYIFAFDDIKERDVIEEKLQLWRKYNKSKSTKLYVLCAYDETEKYDEEFWIKDIIDTFKRIFILAKYDCKPYIMRFKEYENSPHRGIYINLASWGNQPQLLKKMSFRQYSIERGMRENVYKQYKNNYDKYLKDGFKKGACWRYMEDFTNIYPEIANTYFDVHYYDLITC